MPDTTTELTLLELKDILKHQRNIKNFLIWHKENWKKERDAHLEEISRLFKLIDIGDERLENVPKGLEEVDKKIADLENQILNHVPPSQRDKEKEKKPADHKLAKELLPMMEKTLSPAELAIFKQTFGLK